MAVDMPVGWRATTMREAVVFFASGDPFLKLEYSSSGIPVLAKGDVKAFGRLEHGETRYLSPALAESRAYRKTEPGDYLLTTRDLTQAAEFLGLIAPIPSNQQYLVNQGANVVRFRDAIDGRFIVYWCNGPIYRAHIKGHHVGSTQIHLRKDDFLNAPLWLPSLSEQEAIAHILGTLDDKIELNRRMSETLEAMARSLFKSWFVDFDPVRAKSEGRDPELRREITDLFPNQFVESELGEIPEGWKAGCFGDVVESLREQENPLDSPEVVFEHFSIPAFDEAQWPNREPGAAIKSLKLRVPAGAILLSKLNPEIERVWLVDVGHADRAVCSTEFLVLRPRPPFARAYPYCLARSPFFRQQIEALVTGTSKSHQRAQLESILSLEIVIPPARVAQAFDGIAACGLNRTLACRRESRTLAALRDTLLPKLISGERRVGDVQRIIGRSV